ncbi:hypothetical protein [Paraburkholderia terrae]|nr:hypothetical protein [Paraburkholderia terrae]
MMEQGSGDQEQLFYAFTLTITVEFELTPKVEVGWQHASADIET